MNFDFSNEQYLFRDTVRQFLSETFTGPTAAKPRPTAEAIDALWLGLAELGIFSILVPEQYGGLGLGLVDLSLLLEEFGRALVPVLVSNTLIATDVLVRLGSEQQKSLLLPALADGRLKISIAALEPNAGYSIDDIVAKVHTDQLSGHKILVPNAEWADYLLVVARSEISGGYVLALIDPKRPGVLVREHETLDVSSFYHEVDFRNAAFGGEDQLLKCGSPATVMRVMDALALVTATEMVGVSGAVFDRTVDYVKQRNQFGKPLGSFQAIKHRCADMMVSLDSSRSAVYYAAWALAHDAPDVARAVSIAKSFCGDSSRFICDQGTQLHGGMGFTWELGLHLFVRRAKMLEYAHGDASFHRERILAETLRDLHVEPESDHGGGTL